jgi:hypothetical protein
VYGCGTYRQRVIGGVVFDKPGVASKKVHICGFAPAVPIPQRGGRCGFRDKHTRLDKAIQEALHLRGVIHTRLRQMQDALVVAFGADGELAKMNYTPIVYRQHFVSKGVRKRPTRAARFNVQEDPELLVEL